MRFRRRRAPEPTGPPPPLGWEADDETASGGTAREAEAEQVTEAAGRPSTVVVEEPPTAPMPAPAAGWAPDGVLLEVEELRSGYGALPVLHGISFRVRRGETAVILGLNGAGKTTTALNLVGVLKPWSGHIRYQGEEVTGWSTTTAVRRGVVLVPEGRRVFPDLSVERNLQIGAWTRRHQGDWTEQRDRVFEYFPRLRERRNQLAGTLSGGEQQMLAIGRGLMAQPTLLIIDEASLGLAPVIVRDVFDIVRQINEAGVTVILIEQNVGALRVADLALVMSQGTIVTEVRGDELEDPTRIREVFLGS